MTVFDGGREDWDRLGLSGVISAPRDAAAARRARRWADYAVGTLFWLAIAALVIAVA